MTDSDSNLIQKIKNLYYVSAPPEGYSSEYKIYSTSDTGQSSSNYRIVMTRLKSNTSDNTYKNYRLHVFFHAMHEGEKYMTYYAPQSSYIVSKYQTSDYTYDWPTLTVSESITTGTTSTRSSVAVTDSGGNVLGSSAITLYLNDTWTGSFPNYYADIYDTSRTADDFGERESVVDTVCRNWISDYMSTISTDTNYSCDIDTDIISDTDTYEDLDASAENANELILDMDTDRYPWVKTYFARLVYQRSATNPGYRYYRVFHFVYVKGSDKLKVLHSNGNIGVSTANNYLNEYPTIYMRSVDETSNASTFYVSSNDNNHNNSTPYLRATLYYSTITSTSSSATATSASAVSSSQFRDKSYHQYRMDTTRTQADFDDDDIYHYFKEYLLPDSEGSYETEILVDYDQVDDYVSGMENYPYVKFVLTRRKETAGTYSTYKLYAVYRRFNCSNGQSAYVYNTTTNATVSSTDDDWPVYTLYAEGETYSGGTSVSTMNGDTYFGDRSMLYLTMSYYATTEAITQTTSNTYIAFLNYAGYMETMVYDSTVANNFTGSELTTYNKIVNSEEEAAKERDYYERHMASNYTVYYGVDESKDNDFSWYIDSSGNYYFTWLYYRNAWYGSSSASPTAATTQGKFYTYQNPLYGGYQYSSSQTALTTSNLSPDEWEYQGYELDQPMQTLNPLVRYVFKNKSTDEVRKYVFTLGGGQAKTYFGTTMSSTAGMIKEYDLTYRVTFRARTDYASTHMEELLKGYNFKFSIGINNEEVYGDYL